MDQDKARLQYELEIARRYVSDCVRICDNAKMDWDDAKAKLELARQEVDRIRRALTPADPPAPGQ